VFLSIDAALTRKAIQYIALHVTAQEFAATASRLWPLPEAEGEAGEITANALATHVLLFFQEGAGGRALAQRWESEGWRGLDNDERVMMRLRAAAYPTIIEMQRVLDHQSLECLDVLAPGSKPFVIFDRHTASQAIRFDRLLVWVSHYPHYSRLGPAGVQVPRNLAEAFESALRARAGAGPGPEGAAALREYLRNHFGEAGLLVSEVSDAERKRVFASMDAHHCVAHFALAGERAAVRRILEERPDFEPDDDRPEPGDPPGTERYVWLRKGESAAFDQQKPSSGIVLDAFRDGVGALANVRLLPDCLVVETFGLAKYQFARGLVERFFGGLVVFRSETREDLVAKALGATGTADSAERNRNGWDEPEVPYGVEQNLVERFYTDHYRKLLDQSLPALDGMTPRQAAATPAMRPRLVELMKDHLNQMEELAAERGVCVDMDWVLDELGLEELREGA
jgi:hypothetical protein